MVGIVEVKAAYDGIKTAIDMARGVAALNTETDVKLAIVDILRQLLDAQQATLVDRELMTQLRAENDDLRKQLAEKDDWAVDRSRYQLTQSALGAFTYDLKHCESASEPSHRLCTTCFENGKKSILHVKAKHSGGEIVSCHTCKTDLTLSRFQHKVRSVSDRYDELD